MTEHTPETPAPAGWFVTGQTEDTQVTPDGRVEAGVKVLFRTAAGVDSSVFVPNSAYNAENVRTLIAARVATIEAVHALGSSPASS